MRATRLLLVVLLAAAPLALTACGGGGKTVWTQPPASEAEAAYRDALAAMESGQYIEATKQFNELRLKFPFSSRWTNLAELRIADIYLEQVRYGAAAEAYSQFVKAHPTHEEVAYALYKIGVCYYEQMPSDFFILPSPEQRELNSATQADAALRRFLKRYPDSSYVPDAEEKLVEVRTRLADHELYAAEFYLKRDAVVGGMNRLVTLLDTYPDTPAVDAALFLLARAYIIQQDARAAASALTLLVAEYPESDWVEDARLWLASNGLENVEPMIIGKNSKL